MIQSYFYNPVEKGNIKLGEIRPCSIIVKYVNLEV